MAIGKGMERPYTGKYWFVTLYNKYYLNRIKKLVHIIVHIVNHHYSDLMQNLNLLMDMHLSSTMLKTQLK